MPVNLPPLPNPGDTATNGVWGTLLNAFLSALAAAVNALTPSITAVTTTGTGLLTAGALNRVDTSGGSAVRTLPAAGSLNAGQMTTAQKVDTSGNTLRVVAGAGDAITAYPTGVPLAQPGEVVEFMSDGANTWIAVLGAAGMAASTAGPATVTARDTLGRIATVNASGTTYTFTRGASGRVSSFTANGVTRTVTRDSLGRIVSVA